MATLIAGSFAVVGAVIAFVAVRHQVKANAAAMQRQIEATAAEQAKNRAGDRALARRGERLAALEDAAAMADRLSGLTGRVHLEAELATESDKLDETMQKIRRQFDEVRAKLVARRLDLLGLTEASEALDALWYAAFQVVYKGPAGDSMLGTGKLAAKAIATFKAALEENNER